MLLNMMHINFRVYPSQDVLSFSFSMMLLMMNQKWSAFKNGAFDVQMCCMDAWFTSEGALDRLICTRKNPLTCSQLFSVKMEMHVHTCMSSPPCTWSNIWSIWPWTSQQQVMEHKSAFVPAPILSVSFPEGLRNPILMDRPFFLMFKWI